MKHGSLFSGIGGFDLAAQWMGWENLFHCEMNPFGQKVLDHYWPNAKLFTDITKSDFTKYANRIDILTGGFPCQPYSHAGKRLGKEDERHLWPEMLRAIREIQPAWVVGENVSGLISWNGGLVFHEVQTDLEAEGYEVWPVVLPACAVNAPHRRDRAWFIAYSEGRRINRKHGNDTGKTGQNGCRNDEFNGSGKQPTINPDDQPPTKHEIPTRRDLLAGNDRITTNSANIGHEPSGATWAGRAGFENSNCHGPTPDTESQRRKAQHTDRTAIISAQIEQRLYGRGRNRFNEPGTWEIFPTQPPVCSRNDGLSSGLVGITVSKHRNESIKAYGNAIVPQVAFQIFKAIEIMAAQWG